MLPVFSLPAHSISSFPEPLAGANQDLEARAQRAEKASSKSAALLRQGSAAMPPTSPAAVAAVSRQVSAAPPSPEPAAALGTQTSGSLSVVPASPKAAGVPTGYDYTDLDAELQARKLRLQAERAHGALPLHPFRPSIFPLHRKTVALHSPPIWRIAPPQPRAASLCAEVCCVLAGIDCAELA